MEHDLELGFLALQLLRLVFFGEIHEDGELLASLVTDDLLLKAGDEVAGAERKVVSLRLAALKRFAVYKALKVDNSGVAVLGSSVLNGDESGVSLANLLDLLFDQLVGDLGGLLLDLDALVAVDLHLRLHDDLRLKGEAFGACLDRLKALYRNDLDAGFLSRSVERFGIAVLHGVVIEHLGAVHLLDDPARRLALAEALDIDLLYFFFIYFIDCFFKGFAVNADDQLISVSFFFLCTFFQCHWFFLHF